MSIGVQYFNEQVYQKNLGKNPSGLMQKNHIKQFIIDSWKYLEAQTNNDVLIQTSNRSNNMLAPLSFHKSFNNDIHLLNQMKRMQCLLDRKNQSKQHALRRHKVSVNFQVSGKPQVGETENQNPFWLPNPISSHFSRTRKSKLLLNGNSSDKENFPIPEYPNNFSQPNRPFQRPFRPT